MYTFVGFTNLKRCMAQTDPRKQLGTLLNNLQIGLKTCSVDQLSNAIVVEVEKNKGASWKIDLVFELIQKETGFTREELIEGKKRGQVNTVKQVSYCVFHLDVNLTVRYIAKKIFFKSHPLVWGAIDYYKNIPENPIKQDREFRDLYLKIKQQFHETIKQK